MSGDEPDPPPPPEGAESEDGPAAPSEHIKVARSWHEDDLRPPARNAVWMPSLEPFVLDPDVAGVSADHEMGVFGEATKFMWCLCDSIKEEPDACYIMAPEFATVSMLILMMMNPEWTFKRAQLQSMEVYKSVIPEYLLASQKLDFLCFTEGLYKLAETYVPDASAEERTMWLSKMGNRITIRTGSSCLTEEGRAANARALHSLPEWSARHRNSEDAVFGTSTDVANMYDTQLAEDLAHDFEFVDPLHPDDSWRSCPLSQRVVGLFGAEPGTWKYDVSRYKKLIKTDIKPAAHTVHYLKELSEESLRSRASEPEPEPEEETPQVPVVEVIISPPPEPELERGPTPDPSPLPVYVPKKKIPRCVKAPVPTPPPFWVCTFTRKLIVKGRETSSTQPASRMSSMLSANNSAMASRAHFDAADTPNEHEHAAHGAVMDEEGVVAGVSASKRREGLDLLHAQLSASNDVLLATGEEREDCEVLHLVTQEGPNQLYEVVIQNADGFISCQEREGTSCQYTRRQSISGSSSMAQHEAPSPALGSSIHSLDQTGASGNVGSLVVGSFRRSGDMIASSSVSNSGSFAGADATRTCAGQLSLPISGQRDDLFIKGFVKPRGPSVPSSPALYLRSKTPDLSLIGGLQVEVPGQSKSREFDQVRPQSILARKTSKELLQPTRVVFDASHTIKYPVLYEFPRESMGMSHTGSRPFSVLPIRSGSQQAKRQSSKTVFSHHLMQRHMQYEQQLLSQMQQLQQKHNRRQRQALHKTHKTPPTHLTQPDWEHSMHQTTHEDWIDEKCLESRERRSRSSQGSLPPIARPAHGRRGETRGALSSDFVREMSGRMSPWGGAQNDGVQNDFATPLPATYARHDES